MQMDMMQPNVDGSACIFPAWLGGARAEQSILPGEGVVLREIILIGGNVGTTASIAGIIDDQEI